MKRPFIVSMLIVLLAVAALAAAQPPKDPYAYAVKNLYAAPAEDSNLIYRVPIEVQVVDVSSDGNWHKVRIAYNLGPFSYTYVGWAKVPVGDVLAARTEKVAKAPASEPQE